MGYTHYWYRTSQTLDPQTFAAFVADCQAVCARAEIPLASWDGTGEPVFTSTEVAFNGREDCGHRERDLGIMWPAAHARGGIAMAAPQVGTWFAGALLTARTCDGDCSHETFRVTQTMKPNSWDPNAAEIFACCKTAYKPYDILVTACLIVLKHHFPAAIRLSSDGEEHDWDDARRLCQHVLGYGADFVLRGDEEED